jgi:hypothetical protein
MSPDQKLVTDVLSGAITPQTHARLFDDDRVYFAVRTLEETDLVWLKTQVVAASSAAGRSAVLSILSPEHQVGLT